MAEDPRFLLHFKTLEKFKEKEKDGTINPNRHLCFINDKKLIWCRGKFYSDGLKLDGIDKRYQDWELVQNNGSTITITLKGKEWDDANKVWKDYSTTKTINSATLSIAGLMSAKDKTELDRINTANFEITGVTPETGKVVINTTRTTIEDNESDIINVDIPGATTTKAGVMSSQDKTEHDRIETTNFTLGNVVPSPTNVLIQASKLNINTGNNVDNNITIPAATEENAGVINAEQFKKFNNHYSFTLITGNNSITAKADKYDDTLAIEGDEWINTTVTDNNDTDKVTINHKTIVSIGSDSKSLTITIPSKGGSINLPNVLNGLTLSYNHVTGTNTLTIPIQHGTPNATDEDNSTISANASSSTDITGSTSARNVVTGVNIDPNGHVIGVTSGKLYSTDTHYTTHLYVGDGSAANTTTTAAQNTYITIYDNTTKREALNIAGSGINITSNTSGVLTLTAPDMVGATTTKAGTHGLVPAPSLGLDNRYLCSDGTWSIPSRLRNSTTFWGNSYNGSQDSINGTMTFGTDANIGTYGKSDGRPKEAYINSTLFVSSYNGSPWNYAEDESYVKISLDGSISLKRNSGGNSNSLIRFYKGEGEGNGANYWEIGRQYGNDDNFNITCSSNNQFVNTNANIKAESFVKNGGTATQFLMADGSVNEFYFGHSSASAINNVPINKHLCIANNISSSGEFGLLNKAQLKDGQEIYVIIKNTGSSEITIKIPNTNGYIACVTTEIKIPAGEWGEVSAISDGTNIYLRGAAKTVTM